MYLSVNKTPRKTRFSGQKTAFGTVKRSILQYLSREIAPDFRPAVVRAVHVTIENLDSESV
jgi:hypothetical protein